MKNEILIAILGFMWWLFFEWMRGLKRNIEKGTQHLHLIGLTGMCLMIGAIGVYLLKEILK